MSKTDSLSGLYKDIADKKLKIKRNLFEIVIN